MASSAVLVVDDDAQTREHACRTLAACGLGPVAWLPSSEQVRPYLATHPCELVLLDIGPSLDRGIGLIGDIATEHPQVSIVAVSGANEASAAVSCIHHGAYDYLVKPVEPDRLVLTARRALGMQRARIPPAVALPMPQDDAFADFVTADPRLLEIFAYLRVVARTSQPLLITGETGTGKDLIARAVHRLSARTGEYVAVNIAGMDDNMLADCLFGHRKGAFTGANDIRAGLVLRASAGTLFLDEIGDLSPVSQVKLLRLLQDGEYFPLGCDQPKHSTARVIAATSRDLRRLQADGRFRIDLFYRLRAHTVHLPPLRARSGDLPLLLRHFTAHAAAAAQRLAPPIPPHLPDLLAGYPFPGNVRELQGLVHDALVRTPLGAPLSLDPFLRAIDEHADAGAAACRPPEQPLFPAQLPTLAEIQELLIAEALRRSQGNQALAASYLGISRQALHKRLSANRG